VRAVLDLLLPRRCAICSRVDTDLCGACVDSLPRIQPPLCGRCGAPTAWPVARCRECAGRRLAFEVARAAVEYDDAVAKLVAAWKERGQRAVASVAGELVASMVRCPREALALVPVAADADRRLRRGHSTAEDLATALGARWRLPVIHVLVRAEGRPRQRGLGLAARRRNLAGAFAASLPAPARVVLVDDVYTTGATASAAASALRRAGARRVDVITLARAVR